MSRDLINKYIWIIETLQRYGRITRQELNRQWLLSSFSDGQPMARRTFYNYREGILEVFNMEIECDTSTFEYYIKGDSDGQMSNVQNWLLNSAMMSGMLSESRTIGDRIVIDEVPSARANLALIISAMKENRRISFTYRPYSRVNATRNVVVEPYFVRLFKQLWYVVGYNLKDKKVKTYSLDRMSDSTIRTETFSLPEGLDPRHYFDNNFGIMESRGEPKTVELRATATQAKYLRALPLHHSQREVAVHDNYSIFSYRLLLTYDLTKEILSMGPSVTVISPPELIASIKHDLRAMNENYK